MIFEIVLPGLEIEAFSGGDVLREVVEVKSLRRDEIVVIEGLLVEGIVRLAGTDFLRKMMVIEEAEVGVGGEEMPRVDRIGVREQNEAMTTFFEMANDSPHRFVETKNVLPCAGEAFRGKVGFEDLE